MKAVKIERREITSQEDQKDHGGFKTEKALNSLLG